MPSTTFRCPNCNNECSTMMPPKSGNYDISCPKCKKTVNVYLPGADEGGAPAAPRGPLSVQERMRMRRQGGKAASPAPASAASPAPASAASPASPASSQAPCTPAPEAPASRPEPAAPASAPEPQPAAGSGILDVYAALGSSSPAAPQPSPFGQQNPYQQPEPYGQQNPYQQPGSPYGAQPGSPYGQPATPYQQPSGPYGQPASAYGQPAPFGQPQGFNPQNPYGPMPGMGLAVAKLVVVGASGREYQLREGSNIVGRADSRKSSDISIENDSFMSRRSVDVHVTNTGMGYTYELRVLSSTNPVLLNSQQVMVGDARPLRPSDEFVLGNTRFRLQ